MLALAAQPDAGPRKKGLGGLRVLGIVVLAVVITAVATAWFVKTRVFPSEFRPVTLSAQEEKALSEKLEALEPTAYRERDEDRVIRLSEKELNALLAKNIDRGLFEERGSPFAAAVNGWLFCNEFV